MTRAAVLIGVVTIALGLAGCGASAEEERTADDVAREFVDGLSSSQIFFTIQADSGAPETLWRPGAPCDPYSEQHQVLEDVLTDAELDWVCCDAYLYEAHAGDVEYESGEVTIDAGKPLECLE